MMCHNDNAIQRRRLFFALWPDDAMRVRLGREVKSIVAVAQGRSVSQANLHLTLLYLGAVEVSRQAEVVAAVPPLKSSQFTLQLDQIEYRPESGMIWLAPSSPPDALFSLVSSLRGVMRAVGYEFDDRPFLPHVTLMRKVSQADDAKSITPLAWTVGEFSLMVSESSPQGVSYHSLHTWKFN